jgi:hypothetical protein
MRGRRILWNDAIKFFKKKLEKGEYSIDDRIGYKLEYAFGPYGISICINNNYGQYPSILIGFDAYNDEPKPGNYYLCYIEYWENEWSYLAGSEAYRCLGDLLYKEGIIDMCLKIIDDHLKKKYKNQSK